MPSCFAFLPHVRIQNGQELQVGPFILWRNSTTEWVNRFGVDNTAFFAMYRDQRGQPVGEDASVLSRRDYSDASYEEFRDAVYCLSTAIWLRGAPSASDAWVFERWHVEVPTPLDLDFKRNAKFSVNFTSANVDRIYPTPYTYRIDINSHNDQPSVDEFVKELSKPRETSMLTAFGHFHLARFDTPYFTSPGDAVEAMWSGFESLLEIDKFGDVPTPAPGGYFAKVVRIVRSLLGKKEEARTRVGKAEKLRRALRAEFEGHPAATWRPELWDGIDTWLERFYLERNHHSHGARVDLVAQSVEPYGLYAFEIAFHVARAVLRLRLHGDNLFFESQISEEMNSLFLFAPLINRVTEIRHHDRKVWSPGTGPEAATITVGQVDRFYRDLSDLVELRSDSRQFRNDSHVAQARKKMGLVLSFWVTELVKQPPSNVNLSPVSRLPGSIRSWVAAGKENEEINTAIADALRDWGAADINAYGPGASAEPRLLSRNKIPIWLWADAYIRLTDVWLGYPLE